MSNNDKAKSIPAGLGLALFSAYAFFSLTRDENSIEAAQPPFAEGLKILSENAHSILTNPITLYAAGTAATVAVGAAFAMIIKEHRAAPMNEAAMKIRRIIEGMSPMLKEAGYPTTIYDGKESRAEFIQVNKEIEQLKDELTDLGVSQPERYGFIYGNDDIGLKGRLMGLISPELFAHNFEGKGTNKKEELSIYEAAVGLRDGMDEIKKYMLSPEFGKEGEKITDLTINKTFQNIKSQDSVRNRVQDGLDL